MARARKTKAEKAEERNSRIPGRVKFATFVLVVLAIGGSVGVNYLKSPRGAVYLADKDVAQAYERAQLEATATLRRALETQNLRRNIRVVRGEKKADPAHPIMWDIPCDESTDLLAVNVALTEAIRSAGLVVRRSEEFDHGHRLVFDAGTQKYDTHRLTLRRAGGRER
jgi:hypothetical protein